MPNEIYHRSEWGNPKAEGFGDVYFDASATNKLYNHSDYYENSDGTDKILRDIPNKASIVLTPTAYSDGSLNTVLPTDGNGDFDFSRGSSATRVNEKGLIEDVASGIPRIDYTSGTGALLLEPQRRNYVVYSETEGIIYGSNGWTGNSESDAVVTRNYGTTPFSGTELKSTRLQYSGSNKDFRAEFTAVTIQAVATIYVKGTSGETIKFGTTSNQSVFTLTGDWQKIEQIDSTSRSSSRLTINTFSGATARDIEIYEPQVENGSYATSYIPTEGSTVTRSADVANNSGNADLFNDSEGVLYANLASINNILTNNGEVSVSDGSTSNRVFIRYNNISNELRTSVRVSSANVFDNTETMSDTTMFAKVAVKYKENDFNAFINGFKVDFDTSGSVFSANTLDTLNFDSGAGGQELYGKVKELAVFKEALTDLELESLTSWISFVEMATDLEYTLE